MSAFGRALTGESSSTLAQNLSAFQQAPPKKQWKVLAWESEQFGFTAARLDLPVETGGYSPAKVNYEAKVATAIEECQTENVHHLVAFVHASNIALVHSVEAAGFQLLDGVQVSSLDLTKPPSLSAKVPEQVINIRPYQDTDRSQVVGIARSAHMQDRYHNDSALGSGVASRVYAALMDGWCRGEMADAVFVAEESLKVNSAILGFIACKMDGPRYTGVIAHVATASWARRGGVATVLSKSALDWFRERGATAVEVGTQLANIAASRLYARMGFAPGPVVLTFRKVFSAVPGD